jgi:hypothetical protein
MNKKDNKRAAVHLFVTALVVTGFIVPLSIIAQTPAADEPWSFGVMGDSQWTCPTDPADENGQDSTVSLSIIKQINAQFIKKGVKFVIQVGDLTNKGGPVALTTRGTAAQQLYDAGIGFFPMRGNHDLLGGVSKGINNLRINFPQDTGGGTHTFGTENFSGPVLSGKYPTDLKGASYSFDYGPDGNDARFLIVDDWATQYKTVNAAGMTYGYSVGDQQGWISTRLDKASRNTKHAFVFAHHGLIGENHYDCLFNGYTNANTDMQNTFFASLQDNDVKFFISGHDHIYNRSIITSPNGSSKVQSIITYGSSSKFYEPRDPEEAKFFDQKVRQTQLSQEIHKIGFCIYTIDGPRVTVETYSDDHGNWASDTAWPEGTPGNPGTQITPAFTFVKQESWGYSLNGKEFLIAKNQPYTGIEDSYEGTSAKILSGDNGSKGSDYEGRDFAKSINTGWKSKNDAALRSNILTLWGMADFGIGENDIYTLSMSYTSDIAGSFALATKDEAGHWVSATEKNNGGTNKFVIGPYKSTFTLGTYGIDPATKTVWAVINHASDFAVKTSLDGDLNNDGFIDNSDVAIVTSLRINLQALTLQRILIMTERSRLRMLENWY